MLCRERALHLLAAKIMGKVLTPQRFSRKDGPLSITETRRTEGRGAGGGESAGVSALNGPSSPCQTGVCSQGPNTSLSFEDGQKTGKGKKIRVSEMKIGVMNCLARKVIWFEESRLVGNEDFLPNWYIKPSLFSISISANPHFFAIENCTDLKS